MKRILAALAALAIYCQPASAEWSLADMNRLQLSGPPSWRAFSLENTWRNGPRIINQT
jgi:hypothetical protein